MGGPTAYPGLQTVGSRTIENIMAGVTGVVSHKKIANNTVRYTRDDGAVVIRLHRTDIITSKDGEITLRTGGYMTTTTKARLNEYLGPIKWYVYQDRGLWFLSHGKRYDFSRTDEDTTGQVYVFAEGITIMPDNSVIYREDFPYDIKEAVKLNKEINKYAREYMEALFAGNIEPPGNGDCWMCLLMTADGRTMGEVSRDGEHIRGHIDEKYYVPSLLVRAIKVFPVWAAAEGWLAYFWNPEGQKGGPWNREGSMQAMKRSLARYIKRQLYLADKW